MLADVVGHLDGVGAVRFCSDGVRVAHPGAATDTEASLTPAAQQSPPQPALTTLP